MGQADKGPPNCSKDGQHSTFVLIPNENNGNHTKLRNSTNLQLDIKVGHKLQLTIVKNNNKVFARQGPRSRQMEHWIFC